MTVRIRQIAHHDSIAAGKYRFAGPGSVISVDGADVDELLALTFEQTPCCGGRASGPQPMFELADPPPAAQADNKTDTKLTGRRT